MRILVDELPKSCRECPCSIYDELDCCWCKAIEGELSYIADENLKTNRLQSCPLQSLSDYTKQVRKEVIDKIKLVGSSYSLGVYISNENLEEIGKGDANA